MLTSHTPCHTPPSQWLMRELPMAYSLAPKLISGMKVQPY